MEQFLDTKIEEQVKKIFMEMVHPVKIVFFSTKENCEYCAEIQQLLEEVSNLSEKLTLQVLDIHESKEEAKSFGVNDAPVFIVMKNIDGRWVDPGIRFYGIPSGHEFSSLISSLLMVSQQETNLKSSTKDFLHSLETPVHLQVFVTPTCPYCPQAVVLAHQMAMESGQVTSDMIEAIEFQEWAGRYNVSGVPQTTINLGAGTVIGAVSEDRLITEISRSLTV